MELLIHIAQQLRTYRLDRYGNGQPDMRHLAVCVDDQELSSAAKTLHPSPASMVLQWLAIAKHDRSPESRMRTWEAYSGIEIPKLHTTLGKLELAGVFWCYRPRSASFENSAGDSFAFAIDPLELMIAADELYGTTVAAALLHISRVSPANVVGFRRRKRWDKFRDAYVNQGEMIA